MKRKNICCLAILAVLCGCGEYDDSIIKSDIRDLKSRVTALEQQCKNMNENLTSLQTIIAAIQKQDGIVSVTELPDNAGYSVLFTSGKTIYLHNGTNGTDGKDGTDGHAPKISVKIDSDGVYYWTLDGDWLIVDGKKVRAVGIDGKDGADGNDGEDGTGGQNGKDGVDGADGKDGITPRLKIEEDGFWYVTYDNGTTWSKLGKAVGENGKDGADGNDGKDGKDGNNFFKSVTVEDGYAIFVLNDEDLTTIKVPMAGTVNSNTITGIIYVPEYLDGNIRVPYHTKDTKIVSDSFTIRFEILPSSAAAYMEENWKSVLSAKAVYIHAATKSSVGDFISMSITDVKTSDGVASIVISADALDEDFFKGNISASIYFKVTNGANEISSEYIPLVPVSKEEENPNDDDDDDDDDDNDEKMDIPGSVANIVDMGLSVDWASWNVGAESEFDKGGNYGWGDPTGKKTSYDLDDYPTPLPPECIGGGEYDIATQMWGEGWRIPSYDEWIELYAKCNCTIGSSYGVKYMKFVSEKNGNHIYLPYLDEYDGLYWTCDLDEENNTRARVFNFPRNNGWIIASSRFKKYLIRPVHNKVIPTTKDASNVTFESATLNGSVYGVKGEVEVGFYYGTSKPENVNDFENKVSTKSRSTFSVDINGLVDKTTYFYAAYVKDGDNEKYGEISSFVAENSYAIGDYYPNYKNIEGIVFYVDNTKKHGKIVSLDCSPSSIPWMNFPSYTSCNNMDDGSKNTLPVGPLKSWIQGKGTGWYCPAKQELHRICSSIVIINNKLASLGCTRIGNFYWSSTQYSVQLYDLAYIVCVAESNYMGYQPGWSGWTSKTSSYGALAVKKF